MVETATYLGITFDSKLNFKAQAKILIEKLTKATRALLATRQLLNKNAKTMLYNSLFKANLEYAIVAYGDKLTNKQTDQITKLQKQCIRLIFNAKRGVHTKKLYEKAQILPANATYKAEAIKLVHKSTNELTQKKQPILISNLFQTNISPRQTRLSNDTNKINMANKIPGTLIYNICKIWNETPNEIKESGNSVSLKKQLKSTALNGLKDCQIKKCQICIMDENFSYN